MRVWSLILSLVLSMPAAAEEFFTLKGHGGPVKDIAVSPSGTRILTASFDYALGLWQDRQPTWLEAHRAAANTVRFVDERRAVSAGDDFALYLWDLDTGTGQKLGDHKGKVLSLAVSPDQRFIASASWDGRIGLWPLDGSAPRFITTHANVNDVVFSADGTTLYSAASDGQLKLWDVVTGTARSLLVKNGFGINKLVLNENAGWIAYGAVDGVAHVMDLTGGDVIADITLGRRPILAMVANRDMNQIALGDGEGHITLINTTDWSVISDFRATQRGPIWALAFSADGQTILAGGLDDAAFAWPIAATRDAPRMVSADPAFLNGNDSANNGERQFQRKCSICHTLTEDSARRAGPTLRNLFGRRAGTLPGYRYSETLVTSQIIWNAETIDQLFDLGPDVYIAGTKMPMQRITRPEDRVDLIDYLRQFSIQGEE